MLLNDRNVDNDVPFGMVQVRDYLYLDVRDVSGISLDFDYLGHPTVKVVLRHQWNDREIKFDASKESAEEQFGALLERLAAARRKVASANVRGPRDS